MPPRRASYRTTYLLAGLVVLGWLADWAVLGGGAGHSLGWLLALVLVGCITGLSAWSASRNPADDRAPARPLPEPPTTAATHPDRTVRPARPAELAELIEVERAADRLFPLAGYGETPPPATLDALRAAAQLLVCGDPPVGYARVEVVDGRAHLEGLSVRPRFMRQGLGTALVTAACEWAAGQGFAEITLCTFADVPWNGPFYARLGFVELTELTPGLRELRNTERRLGLDAMGRRQVLIRRTGPQAEASGPADADRRHDAGRP